MSTPMNPQPSMGGVATAVEVIDNGFVDMEGRVHYCPADHVAAIRGEDLWVWANQAEWARCDDCANGVTQSWWAT